MHVAGVLAVVREVNQRPPLLSRACALVQMDGDRLAPVASVRPKLKAFLRECGRGTLLVRHRGCTEAAAFDREFDRCWEVSSFKDLAECLERERLLDVFLVDLPLDRTDIEVVNPRLRWLEKIEHRYEEALNLSSRIQACGYESNVPTPQRRRIDHTIIDLYRHLGYYQRAEELARKEVEQSRASAAGSYDGQAQADVILAAALYGSHRFQQMEDLLDPWCKHLDEDRLIVTPMTRVMVFNTLARARVISGRAGWEELFRRSEDILRVWDPTDLPRTWCYLAHGHLRHGRLNDAWKVIRQIEDQPGLNELSRWLSRFLQAEHYRQRGEPRTFEEMEVTSQGRRGVGYPFGLYYQATARQPGRASHDAVERFRLAYAFFSQDLPNDGSLNIRHFLADCMRLGEAAWGGDRAQWDEARQALASQLQPHAGSLLDVYYADAFNALGPIPDRAATEAFLRRVPFS
jgi:hypothetical protein